MMVTKQPLGNMWRLVWLAFSLVVALVWTQVVSVHAQSGLATISGEVWLDANGNGEREDHEPLLANHPVTLISRGEGLPGVLALRVVSDESGHFVFPNIQFGDYTLRAEDGPVRDITVSLERSTTTVGLPVAGQQLFLPMVVK